MLSEKPEKKKRGGVRKKAAGKNKNPRRSDYEFPSLEPSVALARRRDAVEDVASYAHKLSHDEKAWMNQFMSEYNEAVTKDAVFHITAEERKICNDINNSRNRCDYTIAAASNKLNLVENDWEMERILHTEMELDEEEDI